MSQYSKETTHFPFESFQYFCKIRIRSWNSFFTVDVDLKYLQGKITFISNSQQISKTGFHAELDHVDQHPNIYKITCSNGSVNTQILTKSLRMFPIFLHNLKELEQFLCNKSYSKIMNNCNGMYNVHVFYRAATFVFGEVATS